MDYSVILEYSKMSLNKFEVLIAKNRRVRNFVRDLLTRQLKSTGVFGKIIQFGERWDVGEYPRCPEKYIGIRIHPRTAK